MWSAATAVGGRDGAGRAGLLGLVLARCGLVVDAVGRGRGREVLAGLAEDDRDGDGECDGRLLAAGEVVGRCVCGAVVGRGEPGLVAPRTATSADVGGAKETVNVGANIWLDPGTRTMPAVASLAGKVIVIVLFPGAKIPTAGAALLRYAGRAVQGCGPPVGQSPVAG